MLVVKAYVLTAATGSLANIFNALITHFTAAPGFWQLKPAVTNSLAGQALVITQKATPSHDINLRVISATAVAEVLDPLRTITNCGSTATGPTGASAQACLERTHTEATAMAVGVYVIEVQDACYILTNNTAYTAFTRLMGGGSGVRPADGSTLALGIDGSYMINGTPGIMQSLSNAAIATSSVNSQTSSSLVRCGLGSANWYGSNTAAVQSTADFSVLNGDTTNNIVLSPIPVGGKHSTQGSIWIGFHKHMFMYPVKNAVSQTQLPRTITASGTDAWIFVNNAATAFNAVLPWELGVVASKP